MHVEEYFRDRGCVVTGAASGIGFALSEALLQAGAVVFMADRDAKTLIAVGGPVRHIRGSSRS
jgi:NAD(P)-dependent dehydrogenase (short-subunit alcohol dehydrogenase family)